MLENTCKARDDPDRPPLVLVVEDDPVIGQLICELLPAIGCRGELVSDGRHALARLQADGVDLVLLDLMLPNVSGLELCRVVRSIEGAVYLPIIMVTALAGDAERQAGFAVGADDYVTKPFNADELLARVRVWIRTRERLVANHARIIEQERALQDAERQQLAAQVDAIKLAARGLVDVVNNKLAFAMGVLELVQAEEGVPAPLQAMATDSMQRLAEAAQFNQQLERVVRVATRETATGPALDVTRSARRPPARRSRAAGDS
jgi:DNA-binding response OmpR family regulator